MIAMLGIWKITIPVQVLVEVYNLWVLGPVGIFRELKGVLLSIPSRAQVYTISQHGALK